MEVPIVVAILWAAFGGTHVGLAARRPRAALVARLGERGFTALYFGVAAAAFAALVAYYAAHRLEGPPGLVLGASPLARWILMAVIAAGVALAGAGLAVYPSMPMALFDQRVREPRGVERVTRHPFFVGTALVALAHALLATRLAGAVFMGGFAVLALAGARHQDRKLLARRGAAYGGYLAVTSTVPFAAIAGGRQRLVAAELPLGALAIGLAVAVVLRLGHDLLFAHGGVWVIATVLAGAALAGVQSLRRARRYAAPAPSPRTARAGGAP